MFDRSQFKPRNLAQYAIHLTVSTNVAAFVRSQVAENTDLNEDSLPVDIGCYVTGHLVANQTDKITDPAVERVANWLQAKRQSRTAKPEGITVVQ